MRIISETRRFKCPYCGTVVELESDDIKHWNEVSTMFVQSVIKLHI